MIARILLEERSSSV
jgi:hypothetical protein